MSRYREDPLFQIIMNILNESSSEEEDETEDEDENKPSTSKIKYKRRVEKGEEDTKLVDMKKEKQEDEKNAKDL